MTALASEMIAIIAVELHQDGDQKKLHEHVERAAWGALFALEQCGMLKWETKPQ
jgi:hypothetical protein